MLEELHPQALRIAAVLSLLENALSA